MLTLALAFVVIPIASTIAEVLTLPLHAVNKKLQWSSKSMAEWRSLNVESPGERLAALSFVIGMLCTTLTRSVAIVAAGAVFHWRGTDMPLSFLGVAGVLLFVNDALRVHRFLGNPGVWTEMGYGAGGLLGLGLGFLILRVM